MIFSGSAHNSGDESVSDSADNSFNPETAIIDDNKPDDDETSTADPDVESDYFTAPENLLLSDNDNDYDTARKNTPCRLIVMKRDWQTVPDTIYGDPASG